MRTFLTSLAPLALVLSIAGAHAAPEPPKDQAKEAAKPDMDLPPLPADKTIDQVIHIGARELRYQATVGHITLRDDHGKPTGEVVYTAYTVPGRGASRPVTFAFNGGPGASSVFLNMGAIGPKRISFGVQGDGPSDSAVLHDNPGTWLDFTDLVFIDPIGTGFSRSLVDEETTKKSFYASTPDVQYLSRVVYDWLVKNGRLTSRKYMIGESYGGFRVPRMAYYLQAQLGVGMNGIVMVSPYLDPAATGDATSLSPLPWMINLPGMAAAKLEREGKLSADAMAQVEQYDRTEFVTDLLKGPTDQAATDRLSAKVAALTGLDPALVRRLDGRVDTQTFLREVHRSQAQVGSVYDSNVTAWDPFPGSAQPNYNDPLLDGVIAPTTSAAVDFITNQVGWKLDARYHTLSYEVNRAWDRDNTDTPVTDLRKAIANDPNMAVMIAHGWDDLSCPYFGSRLIVDQMPKFGQAERIKLRVYPGGHMFYARAASSAAFKRDAEALFGVAG